ncbi:MAG: ABC transporter permease [Burkholderiales bacterium]
MTAAADADTELLEDTAARRRATLRRYARHPAFVCGAIGVVLLVLVAVFAPWLAPHPPTRTDLMNTLSPPSATYWLGTDAFGRCVLSRLVWGTRISLQVGLYVVLISLTAGTLLGAVAGYVGGWLERVLVAVIDILLAFPSFLLALALVAARGNTLDSIVLAVAIAYTPRIAAVMRSVVLTIRPRPFIEASRAIGLSSWTILVRHVIPNALPPVIVVATVSAATAILAEAGLSFLGLGVQPPTPTWGNVISEGQTAITTRPLISLSAGLCIAFTVVVLTLLGDGLRDTLDPQMRRNTGKLL